MGTFYLLVDTMTQVSFSVAGGTWTATIADGSAKTGVASPRYDNNKYGFFQGDTGLNAQYVNGAGHREKTEEALMRLGGVFYYDDNSAVTSVKLIAPSTEELTSDSNRVLKLGANKRDLISEPMCNGGFQPVL